MESSPADTELPGLLNSLSVQELRDMRIDGYYTCLAHANSGLDLGFRLPLIHELVRRRNMQLLAQALRRQAGVNQVTGSQQQAALHVALDRESGTNGHTSGVGRAVPRVGLPGWGERGDRTISASSAHSLIELLLNYGANPNQQDAAGDTPLHLALRAGNIQAATILVQNMANLHLENGSGEKCVSLAGEDAALLEEVAANRLERLHQLLDAAESGDAVRVQRILHQGTVLSNACDEDGMTALHFAVRQSHVDVIKALLDSHADPHRAHCGGQTPFHFACAEVRDQEQGERIKTVRLLVAAAGQDLDIPDRDGNTPMHIACMDNALECVALLTDAGASQTVLNHSGFAPYQCLPLEVAEVAQALEAARQATHDREHEPKPAPPENTIIAPPPLTKQKSLPEQPKLVRKKSLTKVNSGPPPKKKKASDESESDYSQTYSGSDEEVILYSSDEEMEEFDDEDETTAVQAVWTVLKASDVLQDRQTLIDEVCDVTMLIPSDAAELLHFHKWNKDSCLQAWFAGSDDALKVAAVIPSSREATLPPPQSVECAIFASENCTGYGEVPISDVNATFSGLECGHFMCNNCWGEILTQKITDNAIYPLRCIMCTIPTSSQAASKATICGRVMPPNFIQRLVSTDSWNRYQYLLGKAYVESNPCIKWCPSPDCKYVVNGSLMTHKFGDQPTVTCGDGHQFCFDCCREPHNPATCKMVDDWEARNADQGGDETMIWVQLHSAPCPKCGIAIQKNQGCNHMTCRPPVGCGFDFCWVCKEKWGTCDYYSCNKYKKGDPKPDDNTKDAKLKEKANMLEKYLFYWKRYKAQDLTDKFQAELENKLKDAIESIRQESTDPTALSLCEKMVEGLAQLLRCRTALKWSFVRAFCLPDKTNQEIIDKDLFEQWLGQLAGVCDRLMMELEKPPEEMSLAVLSDQLAIARKNFDHLDVTTF